MQLPSDFETLMREQLGEEQAEALFEGLRQEPTVSIRLNPLKTKHLTPNTALLTDPVPWCLGAYYLSQRPAFTFDPLFHAGAYYVQDASSMYLSTILERWLRIKDPSPLMVLDLCAAPGGKSTLLASLLPPEATLVSNEPIAKRAQILAENMQKWGRPNTFVTQNYPDEFAAFRQSFDIILTDVPCSGEGMFRKDTVAVSEWSMDNVRHCVERQRDILRHIVPCLRPDGLLIYSTCTFNRFEDEEQVLWLQHEYGFQMLEERHFLPGRDRGEGLYIAALRRTEKGTPNLTFPEGKECVSKNSRQFDKGLKTLRVIASTDDYNRSLAETDATLELDYHQAIAYLRREALHIAAPRGIVTVTYRGLPLGLAKSVGTRLNNLYPQEWRIRTTYSPSEPLPNIFD